MIDALKVFSKENPFFEHARMQLWVARANGRDVGRIAGIIDKTHQQIHKDGAVFLGFYECINDERVSKLLFDTVATWAKSNGGEQLLGPMNPSTNDECGLLVEGFETPPVFMMTYNPPYYIKHFEQAGFEKARDLLAYTVDVSACPLDRIYRIAEKTRKKHPELRFRPVLRKTLNSDLARIKQVYNEAWERNWGFVPMTDKEINYMAQRLKPLFVEGLVWLAETESAPVGFLLALPDYNQAFKPLRGKLLTPKIVGFLPYLLRFKIPDACRVITLGIVEKYRNRGLEAVMLAEGFKAGIPMGIKKAEASWILEDNIMMCRVMEFFGGRVYKKYRLFKRSL